METSYDEKRLRIGIAGIVTDYVNIWEKEENLKGTFITDPFEAAKRALAQMKEQTDHYDLHLSRRF